jgi:hypothetical protein
MNDNYKLKNFKPVYPQTYSKDLYITISEVTRRNFEKQGINIPLKNISKNKTRSEELDKLFHFNITESNYPTVMTTATSINTGYQRTHSSSSSYHSNFRKYEKNSLMHFKDKLGVYQRQNFKLADDLKVKTKPEHIPGIVDFNSQLDRKNYSMLRNNKIMTINFLKKGIGVNKNELELFQGRLKYQIYGKIKIKNNERVTDIVNKAKMFF